MGDPLSFQSLAWLAKMKKSLGIEHLTDEEFETSLGFLNVKTSSCDHARCIAVCFAKRFFERGERGNLFLKAFPGSGSNGARLEEVSSHS